ncbi:MAG: YHS domain-containing protein [Patescibacteria group bacterium]
MGLMDFFKASKENNSNITKDPVCGMSVSLEKTEFKSIYKEKLYGFCSEGCKGSFEQNQGFYI